MANDNDTALSTFLEGNAHFASTFTTPPPTMTQMREQLKANGVKSKAVVSCMDPRVIPEKFLGIEDNPTAVLRNAGGRASDALRSLYVLNALREIGLIVVVHHTDCGLTHVKNTEVREVAIKAGAAADVVNATEFGEINDDEASIVEDVRLIRSDPVFARKEVAIVGLLYETETGKLREVTAGDH